MGYITYKPDPGQQSTYSLLEFFRLPAYPMLHCFACNKQDTEMYGGKILTINAFPKDIANNIYGLLESYSYSSEQEYSLSIRRVIVEKVIIIKQ